MIEKLCIIGAGTMGTGIAQLGAQAGLRVFLLDSHPEAIPRSRKRLERSLRGGVEREKITPEDAEAIPDRITWGSALDPLAEADWVIEAVFEDLAAKAEVYRQAAVLVREDVPVATNTSTFLVRDLAALYGRPQVFLAMHFFNPPPAMKLVEVVPGVATLPQVTQAAVALCERMGRTPQVTPDIPGFVANRALGALFSAALEVWSIGGDPEAIDNSVEMGLGHKMGPLRTADLVGLDVMLDVMRSLHSQTGHPRFEVPEAFLRLVEAGKLGRKTGEGFYRYGE